MSDWSIGVDMVVQFLTEAGKPAMANLVRRLHDSEVRSRRAADENLQALYAMRDKYEPKPKPEPYARWTGD